MVISFGHVKGIPKRVAKTFDVRDLTHDTLSQDFLNEFQRIVDYGRNHPGEVLSIGCEKGKHRSVVLANKVATALRTSVYHRDR